VAVIKQPESDPDLNSASCSGIGLKYPHLWDVVHRYILRGDNYFQHGGLTTLAANIWEMPLAEAMEAIERYYEQWGYMPPAAGQRGGVNFAGLRAIHALATTPDIGLEPKAETRKERMLALLNRHRQVVQERLRPYSDTTDMYAADRAAVDETIEAIRNNRQWEVSLKQPEPEPSATRPQNGDAVVPPRPPADTPQISASDLITFKYGLDQLQQRIELRDKRTDERLAELDRSIDRFLGKRQVDQGSGQLKLAWAALFIALASLVVAVVLGLMGPF
jgi:hypothetical protein